MIKKKVTIIINGNVNVNPKYNVLSNEEIAKKIHNVLLTNINNKIENIDSVIVEDILEPKIKLTN